MQNKILENLEKIEVIVAANFAREYPEVAKEVRELAQEAMRETRSLLTPRAADGGLDVCPNCKNILNWDSCTNCGELLVRPHR